MKDDRLRMPIDAPYLHAVGLASICFSRLEWSAVWCCEKLQPGYLNSVGTKTAGIIAGDFVTLSAAHPDELLASKLTPAAEEFKRLVKLRNSLVHANPGTTVDGAQRLFRESNEWTMILVDDLADQFASADIQLNDLFHSVL